MVILIITNVFHFKYRINRIQKKLSKITAKSKKNKTIVKDFRCKTCVFQKTACYKVCQILLQNAAAILLRDGTDVYYKMRQIFYYKMRQLLQVATVQMLSSRLR